MILVLILTLIWSVLILMSTKEVIEANKKQIRRIDEVLGYHDPFHDLIGRLPRLLMTKPKPEPKLIPWLSVNHAIEKL